MQRWIAIALLLAETARGASCCLGGSPKTFIQLRRLQTYELGLSTTMRDIYARYDEFGERESTDGNQTYSLTWGGGARLTEYVQAFAVLPLVYQVNRYGNTTAGLARPGDATLGMSWTVLEHLFFDDWYPTVTLTTGAKIPTGRREVVEAGRHVPGTGNGVWEPFLGASVRKDFEWATLSFSANFTRPFGDLDYGIKDGNHWELIEAVSVPLNRRFSVGGGSNQTWIAEKAQNGATLPNSSQRSVGAFLTSTYFLTPLVDLTGTFEFTVPASHLSVNYPAYRAATLTVKYGFY